MTSIHSQIELLANCRPARVKTVAAYKDKLNQAM